CFRGSVVAIPESCRMRSEGDREGPPSAHGTGHQGNGPRAAVEPRWHPKLDDPACAWKEVARTWLKGHEAPRAAPHLHDDSASRETLVDVAGVTDEQLDAVTANVQQTQLEPPANDSRNTHLDRDPDPHLDADAGAPHAARGQQHERGPIPGCEPSTCER